MVMVNGWLLVIIVILVILVIMVNVFPECVARVSVWLWGSGGWGCVRSTLRLRSQPSATVRNRPQPFAWGPYGRAYGKFLEVSNVSLLRYRVAGVALRDIQTCFVTCRKLFLRGRRNTVATFSEDSLQFSWQAQHFGRVHRHFAWQAQHFRRVVLRVFCESHWISVMTSCRNVGVVGRSQKRPSKNPQKSS